jgi:multiple sugar transport system substrate-binding protein
MSLASSQIFKRCATAHKEETTMASQNPEEDRTAKPMTRRQMLRFLAGGVGASALLAACGGAAAPSGGAAATSAPAAGAAATAAPAAAEATAAPAAGAAATSAPAAGASTRPLTPTFYQWIVDLHPSLPKVNEAFPDLNFQIAPVEGFGIERFVAEGKNQESTWDVYVGMTPFVEMKALIKADVIEPWDNYIPQDVLDDLIPAIRDECTVDGKLYSWPFLLDIVGMGWNSEQTEKAGITAAPTTWDEYLASAKKIQESGAATYGATFDSHGWRSLAPFAHSFSTDTYTPEGLFNFTSDASVEALKLMKEIMALANPDILLEGATDGGVNGTPDEVVFAAQKATYYTKYFNSPLRFAANWPDPTKLQLGGLPKFANGEGSTVFWTTGCCLFKYGQNKEKAAEYVKALTYNEQIWQDSIAGTPTAHPGQLPPYKSLYAKWDSEKPSWMQPFVATIRSQLDRAKAITNHEFSLTQFQIGKPFWEKYLKGEEADPKKALQEAMDAVAAEVKKAA